MKTKISKRQLDLLKKRLMKESEHEKQQAAAKSQKPFRLRRKKEAPVKEEEEVEVEEKTVVKEPVDAEKIAPVPTYDTIKDKLNMVRSGKSLDDADIGPQLQKYFGELSDAEKTGLLAYLSAMAEIVSGGEEAQKVDDPSDSPYKVKMTLKRTGSTEPEAGEPAGTPRVAVAQDTPIVVGESAVGKAKLRRLMERNRQ